MGYPGRSSYEQLGGTREPAGKITNPKKQVGHEYFNEVGWQVAGMNRVSSLVSLSVSAIGERESGAEAWNQKDEEALRVAIDHDDTGKYIITAQATEYPDWTGTPQPVIFRGAQITARSATSVRPPTFTLDSATQITVYTWNAAGVATDMPFCLEIK